MSGEQPDPTTAAAARSKADLDERFARFAETRDPALRDQLVEEHLWLARHAARRFSKRGVDTEDLVQVASFALVKAVDRFDPSTGYRFGTFAMPTMLGELRRHFRDATWAMRVPRRLKDLHVQLRSADDSLTATLGRRPTVDELATELDSTPEEVLEALEAGASYNIDTLDRGPTDADQGNGLELGALDGELDSTAEREALNQALGRLSERDRKIVYLRYYGDLTQSEIAEKVGVSQVHVSRILSASLTRLRDDLEDPAADPVPQRSLTDPEP